MRCLPACRHRSGLPEEDLAHALSLVASPQSDLREIEFVVAMLLVSK